MTQAKEYFYYIDGQWKTSKTNETISIKSPYMEGEVGKVQALSQEEVNESIQLAKKAQKSWAKQTVYARAEILMQWADEILAMKEEIAEVMMREVGKGLQDALKEVVRTVDLIKFTASEAITMYSESTRGGNSPGGSDKKIALIERVPLGVVLAISPFNYPVNLAAAKIAPAIVTGNSVVFKPATQGSLSGCLLIKALSKTSIPANIVNLVTGRGSVIGDYLVTHKDISMISFTGGTETGVNISKQTKMIPLVLELGGKDPAIVLEDADISKAANQIVGGAFSYSGQRCTAIKRVFALPKIADELVTKITEEVNALSVGSPEENSVIVPLIDNKSADYVQSLIDDALEKGATLLTGNKREGNLVYPTLLDNVTTDMRIAWEEPFGPVLPIIRVNTTEEIISLSNESEYGLQASIFTASLEDFMKIGGELEAGSVQWNGKPERGPDHLPFLGVKNSGMGVQGIRPSLESMTRPKVTVINL